MTKIEKVFRGHLEATDSLSLSLKHSEVKDFLSELAQLRASAEAEDERNQKIMLALEDGARQCATRAHDVEDELARSRDETCEVEHKLEDAIRELGTLKEFGCAVRNRLPETRQSVTRKFKIARPNHRNGDLRMYVTVGLYEDGRPGEIFIRSDLTGSFASGALDAVAMCLSMAWQYGVPFEPTVAKLRGMRFEPQGATGDPKYGIVKSPLDFVAKWLLDRFGKKEGTS